MKRLLFMLLLLSFAALAFAQDAPLPPMPQRPEGRQGRFPGLAGTITAVSADQMTLRTMDGRTVTVKLSPDTRFRKDREPAKLADFKVGDNVFVRGEQTGENAWTAQAVMARSGAMGDFREGLGKQFIAGEIKSIDGTKLTIQRIDGETQTIQVDDNTSFRKQGESITLADLKPGDRVYGRGELRNGTFVPSVLNVGEFRRMREGEPRGPGGPREPR